jgi:small-conductance mechanosensitive channel
VILPNSRFLEAEVINWSYPSRLSRLRIPVGVAYGSNPTAVRNALISAAESHKDVLSEPCPRVFFTSFGDSSLNFELLVWVNEPAKQFQIKSDLYFRIEATFRHRHITIPFPQRDLHISSGKLPVEISPQLQEAFTSLSEGLNLWLRLQSRSSASSPPESGEAGDKSDRNGIKSD